MLLTKREVRMAGYCLSSFFEFIFCVLMDRGEVESKSRGLRILSDWKFKNSTQSFLSFLKRKSKYYI